MKCRDCEHWGWGDDEGTPVWGWCWIRTSCPDPDFERSCPDFLPKAPDIFTALSTLQAENEKLRGYINDLETQHRTEMCENGYDCVELGKLRAELEYEKEHEMAYYEECGQWEAENAQLKAKLEDLQRERDAIEQDFRAFTKQWWEQDSGFPCRWCKSENSGGCEWKAKHPGEICAGRAFEWIGPQKEDMCGDTRGTDGDRAPSAGGDGAAVWRAPGDGGSGEAAAGQGESEAGT